MQEIEVCFNGYVLPITVHIDFTFAPGRPATPPSYASGGDPPEGPEIDIQMVTLFQDEGGTFHCAWLENWVEEKLHDDPSYLIERASDERIAEEDEAADFKRRQRRDDNLGRL